MESSVKLPTRIPFRGAGNGNYLSLEVPDFLTIVNAKCLKEEDIMCAACLNSSTEHAMDKDSRDYESGERRT